MLRGGGRGGGDKRESRKEYVGVMELFHILLAVVVPYISMHVLKFIELNYILSKKLQKLPYDNFFKKIN